MLLYGTVALKTTEYKYKLCQRPRALHTIMRRLGPSIKLNQLSKAARVFSIGRGGGRKPIPDIPDSLPEVRPQNAALSATCTVMVSFSPTAGSGGFPPRGADTDTEQAGIDASRN